MKELHRYRRELSERFSTTQELLDYYESVPPAEEILAELKTKIAEGNKSRKERRLA